MVANPDASDGEVLVRRARPTDPILTNYGHFTSTLVDGGHVRGLSLHMDRLMRDCRMRAVFATNAAIGVRAISAIEFPATHAIIDTVRTEYTEIEGDLS